MNGRNSLTQDNVRTDDVIDWPNLNKILTCSAVCDGVEQNGINANASE